MQRIDTPVRPDWTQKCEELGFTWHSVGGRYWDESAAYAFTTREIDVLEHATNELIQMCFRAVDHVVEHDRFSDLGISAPFADKIRRSWEDDEPTLYGRFDFAYDGQSPPRLLEFNADTPTSLLEASVVQWFWLRDCRPGHDQFNRLHEALLEQFRYFKGRRGVQRLYFGCAQDSEEDAGTCKYLMDVALQTEIDARLIYIDEIGWDRESEQFVDVEDQSILWLFKLYPWEWLVREQFGPYLLYPKAPQVIEPAWKMVLSNKGILAILWEMFPNHPSLLPTYREADASLASTGFAKKPLLSREGENVTLSVDGQTVSEHNDGRYGDEGYVYQQYCALPNMAPHEAQPCYPIVGSWIVGEDAAGIGIRESRTRITTNLSQFVPHFIE